MSTPLQRPLRWWVGLFLPRAGSPVSEDARQRARLLAIFSLFLVPVSLTFSVGFFALGDIGRGTLIVLFSVNAAASLLWLRWAGMQWAAWWWHTVFFSALVGFSLYDGIDSATPAWMGLMLLLITLVSGSRAGLIWSAPAIGATLVLSVLQHRGVIPFVPSPPRVTAFTDAVGYATFLGACVGLGAIFERTKQGALQQLAEARDDARTASEAKSSFLATMSHEIRTPMNGIFGLTELLQETPLSDDQQRLVRTLRSSSRALVDIIGDILDFSKIEAGRMEVERVPTAPHLLIHDVVALFAPAATRKGLTLRGEIGADVPEWIWSDPTRIRQLLTNLVSNAIKFTATGEVVVRAGAAAPGCLRLEVQDTGPGVSAQQQQSLFEPFTQAESSTTRQFGGTGLGLAICWRIAALMGGDIGVESDGQTGSRFWVRLPAEAVPLESEPTESVPLADAPLAGHILLVEDNPINQLVASRMLAQLGLTVHIAKDGESALAALAAERFSLVLMDCQMPVMDGFTATQEARRGGHTLPIIALTADTTAAAREAALESGMDAYISKPISIHQLRSALQDHLPAPQAAAAGGLSV